MPLDQSGTMHATKKKIVDRAPKSCTRVRGGGDGWGGGKLASKEDESLSNVSSFPFCYRGTDGGDVSPNAPFGSGRVCRPSDFPVRHRRRGALGQRWAVANQQPGREKFDGKPSVPHKRAPSSFSQMPAAVLLGIWHLELQSLAILISSQKIVWPGQDAGGRGVGDSSFALIFLQAGGGEMGGRTTYVRSDRHEQGKS